MKTIIYNNDNLKKKEINDLVVRVKAIIIRNNKLLIGSEDLNYQFIGGHVDPGETKLEALIREVKEETGITINENQISEPFLKITYINKDYPKKGINRENDIYYYEVKTSDLVNLNSTNYTESEINKHFTLIELDLDKSIELIKENIPNNPKNEVVSRDMIYALNIYNEVKNENIYS